MDVEVFVLLLLFEWLDDEWALDVDVAFVEVLCERLEYDGGVDEVVVLVLELLLWLEVVLVLEVDSELELVECVEGLAVDEVFELLLAFELELYDGGFDEDFEDDVALEVELLLEEVVGFSEVVESVHVVDVV